VVAAASQRRAEVTQRASQVHLDAALRRGHLLARKKDKGLKETFGARFNLRTVT
jgi:hypothetical protein